MKKKLFIEKAKRIGIFIIPSNEPIFNLDVLIELRDLKEFTQYINFNCQISSTGGCKENIHQLECCCYQCLSHVGFFKKIIDTDIPYYAKRFSVKTGFWREGKGCILPRKMRSIVCVTHHCNYNNKEFPGFNNGMIILKEKMYQLSRMI